MRARLSQIEKRYDDKTDEELEALIAEKQAERRTFAREHRGPFPEDVHARFDELIAEAQAAFERGLAQAATAGLILTPSPLVPGKSLSELATFYLIANDSTFQGKFRASIDASSPPVSKAKVDQQLGRLDGEIAALEVELKRREVVLRRDEADAELAGLGGKTA